MLEGKHIFPIVRKMKGVAAQYPDILVAQHQRGREITDYVLAVTNGSKISVQHGESLARVFEGFVRMYDNHAAGGARPRITGTASSCLPATS